MIAIDEIDFNRSYSVCIMTGVRDDGYCNCFVEFEEDMQYDPI